MAVVREGILQLGKNPHSTSSKDWKPFLFVLKHDQELKQSFLDYYKDGNKRWQKQEKRGSIVLWPYFQVSLAHECSYQYPLKITDPNNKEFFLAASNFEMMNRWCNSLQRQTYLVRSTKDNYREFLVKPQKSASTTLIGASGDCILAFTPQKQMVCALLPSRQKVGVWPYGSLRTYWGGKGNFGFKAGRRSPRGEGEFVFLTAQGEEIYHYLERTVRLTSMAAKSELLDSLPPDPTRSETPVASSDSDEGEPHQPSPPHVPLKPPDVQKRLSIMGPLPQIPSAPHMATSTPSCLSSADVSDTSPAYFVNTSSKYQMPPIERVREETSKRSQSMGAVLPESHTSLVGPSHSLPLANRPLPLEDEDTYSHASHDLPQRFTRNTSVKVMEDGALYDGLVRTESTRSTTKPTNRRPEGDVADPQPDDQLYDLAYPPNPQQAKVLTPFQEGEYGSMGDAEDLKRELVEKRLVPPGGAGGGNSGAGGRGGKAFSGAAGRGREVASDAGGREGTDISGNNIPGRGAKMLSSDNIPFGAQLRRKVECVDRGGKAGRPSLERREDDEGLTDNPLYDSTENMLSPTFLGAMGVATGVTTGVASYDRDGRHHEGIITLGLDLSDSMIMNPVYGEHAPEMMTRGVASGGVSSAQSDSPLEHSMATNPLYGRQQDLGLMPESQVGESNDQNRNVGALREGNGSNHDQDPGNSKETTNIEAPGGGRETCNNSGGSGKIEDTQHSPQAIGKGDGVQSPSFKEDDKSDTQSRNRQGNPDSDETVDDTVKTSGLTESKDENPKSNETKVEHVADPHKGQVEGTRSPHKDDVLDIGGTTGGGSPHKDHTLVGGAAGGGFPLEDDSLDIRGTTGGGSPHKDHALVAGAAGGGSPQKDHTLNVGGTTGDVGGTTGGRGSPHKGDKGYSKVDKKKKKKENTETGDKDTRPGDESPPPPIPPRKY